jgi:hypothetical protein
MAMPNVSTVDWTPEFIERFEAAFKKLGFRNRSHFFDKIGTAFVRQVEAGEELDWPPRFALKETPKRKRPVKRKPRPLRPARSKPARKVEG